MKLSDTKTFAKIPVVYGMLNTAENKWYIGSCCNFQSRMQRHRYYLRNNLHHSPKLQQAYNEFGENCFDVQILFMEDNIDKRLQLERDCIEQYNSIENGYNMTDRCSNLGSRKQNEEAMQNFLLSLKPRQKTVIAIDRFTGLIENEFESVSSAARFYHTSSSNISRTCTGLHAYTKNKVFVYSEDFDDTKDYRKKHHCAGIKLSDAQRLKMSISNQRRRVTYKYDSDMNLICEYMSRNEAEKANCFKHEYLRHRLDMILDDGYIYSHTKY